MPLIARLVLGRHWNAASDAQRTAYLDAFRVYAVDSLPALRASSTAASIHRAGSLHQGDQRLAWSATEATRPARPQPVRIDWRVRETAGNYRLIDVAIEGVSLVVTNRSEFDSVVARRGPGCADRADPRQERAAALRLRPARR